MNPQDLKNAFKDFRKEIQEDILASENRVKTELRKELQGDILASENRVKADLRTEFKKEIKASEKRLEKKIDASQEDTINILTDVIETGYNMHDKRIAIIESHLNLSHKN